MGITMFSQLSTYSTAQLSFLHQLNLPKMARTTSFIFFPTSQPQLPRELEKGGGALPAEYFLARLTNGVYDFDHKFMVYTDPTGSYFQVLTKDQSGNFTVALPANSFLIEEQYLKIELKDIYEDGSEYAFVLSAGDMDKPDNRIVLKNANNPDFLIAETRYTSETTIVTQLGFIGSIDVRAGDRKSVV